MMMDLQPLFSPTTDDHSTDVYSLSSALPRSCRTTGELDKTDRACSQEVSSECVLVRNNDKPPKAPRLR
jgi:hypothetical protein